jgi:RNA polymerase sigma-54 factor
MLKQQLGQKLLQKLSPQQIQLMKLIQLPTLALEQKIKEELEANPALEEGEEQREDFEERQEEYQEDDNQSIEAEDINVDEYLSDDEVPDYRLKANNYSADDEDARVPVSGGTTFSELLLDQISMLDLRGQEREIAEYLVGNIDDEGYIRRELSAIVDDLAFTQNIFTEEEKLEEILSKIQSLDPPGVGARDLRECLMLQLKRKTNSAAIRLAMVIISKHFDEFAKKHYKKLMDRLEIDEEYLKDAIEEISRLNPKPGNSGSSTGRAIQQVIPDFNIQISEGELELSLNGRNAPELNVSREYKDMLETYKTSQDKNKSQKEAVMFVKQKLDSAKWFIEAIRQRQQTLMLTMSSIMHFQEEYFLTGDQRKLRPMILKDIADEIGMDISTVSRVASNKYVSTPYGTFLIKEFFSESMKNEAGEDVSTKQIKKILEDAISEENKRKPLTDDALAKVLKDKGFPIARRTIAKYREQLDIPVARLRKEL